MTITLNQKREDFEAWLKSLPESEYAITAKTVGEPTCWIGRWFLSQGVYVWSVSPHTYFTPLHEYFWNIGILLNDPDGEDFCVEKDIVGMSDWMKNFTCDIHNKYLCSDKKSYVTRDQALEILEAIAP